MTKPAPKKRVAWLVVTDGHVHRPLACFSGRVSALECAADIRRCISLATVIDVVRVEYPWPPRTARKRRKP